MKIDVLVVGATGPHRSACAGAAPGTVIELDENADHNIFWDHYNRAEKVLAVKCHKMLPWEQGKTYVIHDSLLPRHKGFAPVAHGILAGDTLFGATLFLANGRPDDGRIIGQRSITIEGSETAAQIQWRLLPLYMDLTRALFEPGQYGRSLIENDPKELYPDASEEQLRRAARYDVH